MSSIRASWQQPKVFKQTVLQFRNLPTVQHSNVPVSYPSPRRAAPELPPEIWDLILTQLSNIALKALRLTCSSWSKLGTNLLFNAVCLDSFEESWSNLQSLSLSPFAHLVHTIEVRPLYLPRECLDANAWYETYSNLLAGLCHSESVNLFQKFQTVFKRFHNKKGGRAVLDETSTTRVDLANLKHCRRVIFSDNIDVNTKCRYPILRTYIQRAEAALDKPGTWGLRPPAMPIEPNDLQYKEGLVVYDRVLHLLKCSPSITHLELYIWDFVWQDWSWNDYTATSKIEICKHLTHLSFQVKFCHFWEMEDYVHALCTGLGTTFGAAGRLPNLKSFNLSAKYSEPDLRFSKYHKQRLAEADNPIPEDELYNPDQSDGDDISSVSSSWSRISQIDSRFSYPPAGLSKPHFHSLVAHLVPSLVPFEKLETVELSSVCICANSLLIWLISKTRDSTERLNVNLCGSTILYGMNPSVFLAVIQSLPVNLQYDDAHVIYYESCGKMSDFHDFAGQNYMVWVATIPHLQNWGRKYATRYLRGTSSDDLEEELYMEMNVPQRLRDVESLQIAQHTVIVKQYPTQLDPQYLVTRTRLEYEERYDYYYCTWSRVDKTIKFDWYDHKLLLKSDFEENYLMLKTLTIPEDNDDWQ